MLHGSSSTWFQTSRYCRAIVEFSSINLVRHGGSTTFETGLREKKQTMLISQQRNGPTSSYFILTAENVGFILWHAQI